MARTDNPDPIIVRAIIDGRYHPPIRPRYADRVAACRELARAEYTDGQIATFIRVSSRTVLRMRNQHGIPGQPVGVNAYTRKHQSPNPVASRKGIRQTA